MMSGARDEPASTIVLCPATGVPPKFYTPFAAAARQRGVLVNVVAYDPHSGLDDWILRQIPNAIGQALRDAPKNHPVFVLGHSIGAQALGFAPVWNEVSGIVRVAASTGYVWRTRRPLLNAFRLLVLMRFAAAIMGHLPAGWSGLGTDLSEAQVKTWAKWCGRPGYCHSEFLPEGERLAIRPPVLDIFSADDPYVTPVTRADLNRFYDFDARTEIELTEPLGHVGFFRRENKLLWVDLFNRLESMISIKNGSDGNAPSFPHQSV